MTNKPREFYVLPPFLDMSTVHTCFAHKPHNLHTEPGKYTHVIEYSAYEQVCKERDSLKAQLEIAVKALEKIKSSDYKSFLKGLDRPTEYALSYAKGMTLNSVINTSSETLEQIQKMLRKNEGDEQW